MRCFLYCKKNKPPPPGSSVWGCLTLLLQVRPCWAHWWCVALMAWSSREQWNFDFPTLPQSHLIHGVLPWSPLTLQQASLPSGPTCLWLMHHIPPMLGPTVCLCWSTTSEDPCGHLPLDRLDACRLLVNKRKTHDPAMSLSIDINFSKKKKWPTTGTT